MIFFYDERLFFGFCIIPPSQTPDGTESFPGRSGVGQAPASVVLAGFGRSPEPVTAFTLCILAYYVGMRARFMKVPRVAGVIWLRASAIPCTDR